MCLSCCGSLSPYLSDCVPLHRQLRVEPGDHVFVMTEPPLNPPESREALAEIMFEGFGCAGLYIGVQVVPSDVCLWRIIIILLPCVILMLFFEHFAMLRHANNS